ncbi:MAG TPA: heme-copper oxidase subunit III [Pyrinomonadaceae bacterium]|nr:heme-copper oxidase subunit III [Pyrinomonadaceae bacterium]
MATTVTSTRPLIKKGIGSGPGPRGPSGNGARKRNGHDSGFPTLNSTASRYRIGMWVALAAILMMFTALTSAYIVRSASASDWQPLKMPRILLLSTALILVSSLTLETARRKLKATAVSLHRRWLMVTATLGLGFLVSQLIAWKQLVGQGVYVSSNPHSSFFYLLTATHGVHLLGGLMSLVYLSLRTRPGGEGELAVVKRQGAADAVTLYWHFMDVLWLYLFVLLFFWR